MRWPFRLPHPPGDRPSTRVRLAPGSWIGADAWINLNGVDARLVVGEGTAVGHGLVVSAGGTIEVGPGTLLSARVTLLDQQHDFESWTRPAAAAGTRPRFSWALTAPRPVVVGAGCWLGIGVVVLPGARIGDGCVVGANSVVSGELPAFSVAAGAPARVLRSSAP